MQSPFTSFFIYGAGTNAYGIKKYVGETRILGVIDSSPARIGKKLGGIKIIGLEEYLKLNIRYPIIISAYQKQDEIAEMLLKNGINNFFLSLYVQSNVTEIEKIVDKVLFEAKGRQLVFDNTSSILTPMIIDELIKRRLVESIGGCLQGENQLVVEYYDLEYVNALEDNCFLIITKAISESKEICSDNSINICNYMYYNSEYRNAELEKYKNIHTGKRCFIIGNGPSLRIEDLNQLMENGDICFGSNGIFLVYDKTDWRPDYYVIADYIRFKENYDVIKEFKEETVFIRKFYNMEGLKYPARSNVFNNAPQRDKFEFSDDICEMVYSGLTVTYNMLQIAAYMGFSKIYLLGVDFSFDTLESKGTNHFDKRYEQVSTMNDLFYYEENLAAYSAAEEFSREHNFRIYNATRGGKLEVFERVHFEDLF